METEEERIARLLGLEIVEEQEGPYELPRYKIKFNQPHINEINRASELENRLNAMGVQGMRSEYFGARFSYMLSFFEREELEDYIEHLEKLMIKHRGEDLGKDLHIS